MAVGLLCRVPSHHWLQAHIIEDASILAVWLYPPISSIPELQGIIIFTTIVALQKPPPVSVRDQTSFTFPQNGTGIRLPFPSDLAALTGLKTWPPVWTVPPFTPNMQKAYNASATAIIPDITGPPNAQGRLSCSFSS